MTLTAHMTEMMENCTCRFRFLSVIKYRANSRILRMHQEACTPSGICRGSQVKSHLKVKFPFLREGTRSNDEILSPRPEDGVEV